MSVKNYICSADGIHYPQKENHIKLRMSVCPTSFCPANCPFCIATNTKTDLRMDLKKLEGILKRLKQDDRVLCVTFTGGEPFYDVPLLDEAVSMVFEILGLDMEVSISTNGMNLDQIHKIKYLSYIDAIHVSRHHYDDTVNNQIFGRKMPTSEGLREAFYSVSYRDIFVLNCMLQKDYIGTWEEAHRFLDYAITLGVPKVSFITCSPINDYAKAQRIEYEKVIKKGDSSLLFTRGFQDFEFCHCDDGVYVSPQGDLIEFYGRTTATLENCSYCRGITYGADSVLRSGFCGEVIC